MISIAICDDDDHIRSLLKTETLKMMENCGEKFSVDSFSDPEACFFHLQKNNVDLLFLDIEMPGMDGFSLAKKIQKSNPELSLIFVSSHENMVFDSYEYDALWFVRKSKLMADLDKAVKKFLERIIYNHLCYVVRDNTNTCKLLYKDILYFECNAHTISVRTTVCTHKMTGSLKKLEEELRPGQFARVHKSFLVNLKHIYTINSDTITLSDGSRVPLSKERRSEVRKIYFNEGEQNMG